MSEPLYTYHITDKMFYCYVIQPDLELYSLTSDKDVIQYKSGVSVQNYDIDNPFLKYKFSEECLFKLGEFLNVQTNTI